MEGLARCREEAEAHLRDVREKVDSLPRQVGEGWGCSLPRPSVPPLAARWPLAPRFR